MTSGHCRSSKVKNVFPSHFLSKNKMTFFSRLYTKIYTFKEFILKLKSNTSQKDIKLPTRFAHILLDHSKSLLIGVSNRNFYISLRCVGLYTINSHFHKWAQGPKPVGGPWIPEWAYVFEWIKSVFCLPSKNYIKTSHHNIIWQLKVWFISKISIYLGNCVGFLFS